MLEYCRSDVDILWQGCLKFRELLVGATGMQREVINGKGKKELKWFGAVYPFDSVTIASVCISSSGQNLSKKNGVKLEGKNEWIPANVMDKKFYVLRDNKWIHETALMGKRVSEKEFVRTPIAKIPPSGYNDQYSKTSIQWLEWMERFSNVGIKHVWNIGGER